MAKPVDPGAMPVAVAPRSSGLTRFGYLLATVPFVLLGILNIVVPGFMQPIYLNPPAILGLPAGILLMLLASIWAALGFVTVRVSRSGVGIAVAIVVFTIPAIVAIVYIPALMLIVLNLTT